jgi:hypothetical protein
MKTLVIFILLTGIINSLYGQELMKSRTRSGYVNISKDLPKVPNIEIVKGSLTFSDADGNQIINANEATTILFQLKNSGTGPGLKLEAIIAEKNALPGLKLVKSINIGTLPPGAIAEVEIPVTGTAGTTDSKALFSISIIEANGFGTDPEYIEVPVKAFESPMVRIVDSKITSQTGTLIEKKKPFEVQVLVQNVGQGKADNISLVLPVPENMFCLSDNTSIVINSLAPGEQKLVEYSFIANNNYTLNDIELDFQLKEQYNKYAENKNIHIAMNQQVASDKLVIQGKSGGSKIIEVGSLSSSVDKNIPINPAKKPYRIALIIGNEDYSGNLNAEVNVDYAKNDATIFKQYVFNTLGVPEENINFLINSTAGEMRKKIELVAKLLEKMGPSAELIFYYAGHGLPDESTKAPYLIPVDVDASNLSAAIKLSDVYNMFGNSGASRITVFLDACFSGGGRNQGLLSARGVKIVPRNETITGNMIVFSASTSEQSALPLKREKHGIFTFFLLKKLQETGGVVTYNDLAAFINQNVSVESLKVNGKEQDPGVSVSPALQDKWKTWKMKD